MARILRIAALIFAGEMMFALPFHTQRFFRATLLEGFNLSNTQLGDMFAAFGVTAMISYFFGGPFADRYSARSLMAISLLVTATGGLYMASFPGVSGLILLYGFWGVSATFLFWSALIKATRDWGGSSTQGLAFGVLDGGRGLAAAVFGAIAVGILAIYLPTESALVTDVDRRAGLRNIILYYSLLTFLGAVLVWFLVPHNEATVNSGRNPFTGIPEVIRTPLVWAQAGIIVSAYCGYKGMDTVQLYGVEVLGLNEVDAAKLTTWGAYIRPVAAVIAGLIADRFNSAHSILVSFLLLIGSFGVLATATPETLGPAVVYANLFLTFFVVFAIRGIYYALLEETRTPKHLTGASVAVIAFVGYTPEIFFGPVSGRILDANPGIDGHQNYYLFLTATAVCGVLVSLLLIRLNRKRMSMTGSQTALPVD